MPYNITIIVPIYNQEPYLRQCLDSIVNQTMRDIQIICVNDGSTDGTLTILEEYAANDKRIMVLDKKNEGQGIARNFACEHVLGRYVLFVDADDWIEPNMCHNSFYRAEVEQSDVLFSLREKNGRVEGPPSFYQLQFCAPNHEERVFLLENIKNGPVAKLYKTDFLRSHSIRFTHHRRCQDIPVHWQSCLLGNRYTIHPEILYHVRVVDSEPGCGKWEKVKEVIGAYQAIKTDLKNRALYRDYREMFLKDYFKSVHVACKKIIKGERPLFIREFLDTLDPEDVTFLREYRFPSSTTRLFYREIVDSFIDKKAFSISALHRHVRDIIRSAVLPFEKALRTTKRKKREKRSSANGADYHKRQYQALNDMTCRLSEMVVHNREDNTPCESDR